MSANSSESVLGVLTGVDLAMSAVRKEFIDDPDQYFFGVVEGMKLSIRALLNPDLVFSEVVSEFGDGDIGDALVDKDRVLGMLVGSFAVHRLVANSTLRVQEPEDV